MVDHTLHYAMQLPLPRQEVFSLFSDAGNLERLTPPELKFCILTPLPIEMKAGAEIVYRLQLFGVSFRWKTGITVWNPPDLFVDEQLEGPYQTWIHRHSFRDGADGSTIIEDDVLYRLPAAPMGELAYPLVRAQLERIFKYRQERVRALLLGQDGKEKGG
jgi:ligand-binding SRPBCC domain-containing protein